MQKLLITLMFIIGVMTMAHAFIYDMEQETKTYDFFWSNILAVCMLITRRNTALDCINDFTNQSV